LGLLLLLLLLLLPAPHEQAAQQLGGQALWDSA
jgi:hypothetical protein